MELDLSGKVAIVTGGSKGIGRAAALGFVREGASVVVCARGREALDLAIFLHPVETIGGDRLRPFFLSNLIGNPVDTAVAACHLIFGGVLDRHPKLQICLPHAGGVLPILVGRLDQGWNVRDELKHLPHAPSNYLQRFTYDTITHSKPTLEFVIKQVGSERVMVGSDYCFTMGYDRPVQFLDQVDLTSVQRRMILAGNAERLLKL